MDYSDSLFPILAFRSQKMGLDFLSSEANTSSHFLEESFQHLPCLDSCSWLGKHLAVHSSSIYAGREGGGDAESRCQNSSLVLATASISAKLFSIKATEHPSHFSHTPGDSGWGSWLPFLILSFQQPMR